MPEEPIPESWEGQEVNIMALSPEDPLPDLDQWLATLEAMGPAQFEDEERELIDGALAAMNQASKRSVAQMMGIER